MEDLTGKRFGALMAVRPSVREGCWWFICDCNQAWILCAEEVVAGLWVDCGNCNKGNPDKINTLTERKTNMDNWKEQIDRDAEVEGAAEQWFKDNLDTKNKSHESQELKGFTHNFCEVKRLLSENPKDPVLKVYTAVHPLHGCMTRPEAVKALGTNYPSLAYRLCTFKKRYPHLYDLDRFPSVNEIRVLKCVHPLMGCMTYREAAAYLGINKSTVTNRLKHLQDKFPAAEVCLRKAGRPRSNVDVRTSSKLGRLSEDQIRMKF